MLSGVFLLLSIFFFSFLIKPIEATSMLESTLIHYDEPHHLIEVRVNLTSLVPIREVILCYYYINVLETPTNVSMKIIEQTQMGQFNSTLWSIWVLAPVVANISFAAKIYVIDFHGSTTEIPLTTTSMLKSQRNQAVGVFSVFTTPFTLAIIGTVLGIGFYIRKSNRRKKSLDS